MKTLTLLRHAKSGWDSPDRPDHDRPLNAKGERAAATIGRHLARAGMRWDRVVASTALRVRETVAGVERGYGAALDAAWERRLYLADPATLVEMVQAGDDACARLMIVGHNPGLEQLVPMLAGAGDAALIAAAEAKFPTASVAVLTFDVGDWRDVREGGGMLSAFVRPRDLDPALGPDA